MKGRIMLAAAKSGSGKTTLGSGLLYLLRQRGIQTAMLKCGPDYIDSMFAAALPGVATGNLDSFLMEPGQVREKVARWQQETDFLLLEGAMGYYDGICFSKRGSSYEMARESKTPVVLVMDCKGMGASVLALLRGFLEQEKPSGIAGVICNRMPEKLYREAKEALASMGIVCLGFVPEQKELVWKSRHLGLQTPDPLEALAFLERAARAIERTVDVDALLQLAGQAEQTAFAPAEIPQAAAPCHAAECNAKKCNAEAGGVRIAVAMDEAFCFCYEDNLRAMQAAGLEPVFFSPLRDKGLPENIDGLYLCGGYPELYAEKLQENVSMRQAIYRAVTAGLPTIAECGGFMYLHRGMAADLPDRVYEMAGVLPGLCQKAARLSHFGYHKMRAKTDSMLFHTGEELAVHEFHYYESSSPGDAFLLQKEGREEVHEGGFASPHFYGGYPHLYFDSCPPLLKRFRAACEGWRANKTIKRQMQPKEIDREAAAACRSRWNGIAKPLHSLGAFERAYVKIAGITGRPEVPTDKKAILVFCADNGIAEEDVCQSDSSVTAVVAENMAAGLASINQMSALSKTEVIPVDIGMKSEVRHPGILQKAVVRGTRNFRREPAMTEEETRQAIETGKELVRECRQKGYDLLGTGEMGIGNTTTSAAVLAVLLQKDAAEVTGMGAGLSQKGLLYKRRVIGEAIEHYHLKGETDVIRLLSCVGGLDLAGLTGVFLGGALYGMPVVLDGVITAAAALCAEHLLPGAKEYMLASHLGREPAHRAALEALSLTPVIHGDLALGEGSGAALFFACLASVSAVYEANRTFQDIRIQSYEELE